VNPALSGARCDQERLASQLFEANRRSRGQLVIVAEVHDRRRGSQWLHDEALKRAGRAEQHRHVHPTRANLAHERAGRVLLRVEHHPAD
jgi:hypothetical protein